MARILSGNRKQFIIEEAGQLFREKGYTAASMRDLAERVGVEAASLYNHIKSKDELLREICFRVAHEYVSHLSQTEQMEATYAEKVRALLRMHIAIITHDISAVSVANNEWKHLPEPYLSEFTHIRRDYERRFAALIQKGIEAGEFRPVNPKIALFTLLAAVRWVEIWYKPGREISPQTLERDIETILIHGLTQATAP
ncbi:MAG: TetR/AcrR family transcriptional regulator [Bacteroidetes bacterium]|jgi:TetR/AcrR family transcriptional regulator, cholesterol catabolism regulator|nr:MAG: TetR/AcrR family transcriptional regulator [Bacteroidota bacterium]